MKKIIIFIFLLLLAFISSCNEKNVTIINNVENVEISSDIIDYIDNQDELYNLAVRIVKGSVVGVIANNPSALIDSSHQGSAVIIEEVEDGYMLLTCYHVLLNSSGNVFPSIKIYLGSLDLSLDASFVIGDEEKDLALIKVETDALLKVINFAESVDVGDGIIAIGSPHDIYKYYDTACFGKVSYIDRKVEEKSLITKKNIENKYLQFDASIYQGMSGGGVFNLKGEFIGLIDWRLVSSEEEIDKMSFAIPLDVIRQFLNN